MPQVSNLADVPPETFYLDTIEDEDLSPVPIIAICLKTEADIVYPIAGVDTENYLVRFPIPASLGFRRNNQGKILMDGEIEDE